MPLLLDIMTSIPLLSSLQALHNLAASFVNTQAKEKRIGGERTIFTYLVSPLILIGSTVD